MAINDGDQVKFLRSKDYIVLNNNLGSGSFGRTIIIKDTLIDEVFVCKKYDPYQELDKSAFYETFVSEIKIMHKLFHPNVVRIFNYYLYPEHFTGFIVMEHIDGKPIDDYFKNNGSVDSNDLFIQLIDAFTYLENNGIIHRDIRSTNILVTNTNIPKIIDFGLGKIVDERSDNQDSFNSLINRHGMQALPEEFSDKYYDSLTDMFCLAELLNRILKDNNVVNFKYHKILQKMMKVKRKDRYNNFLIIKNEIISNKIDSLNISDDNKLIYQNFTNSIMDILSKFKGVPKYEQDLDKIITRLQDVVSTNIMEDEIQRNDMLVDVFITSNFTFYRHPKVIVSVDTVNKFFNWFIDLNDDDKELIVRSIYLKFGKIHIDYDIDNTELPF